MSERSSYASNTKTSYTTIDANRVRAQGEGLTRAFRNEKATFTVDTREGGERFIYDLFLLSSALKLIYNSHSRQCYVNGRCIRTKLSV